MRTIIVISLLFVLSIGLKAQKNSILTSLQMQSNSMSPEQLLSLPPAYVVLKCEISIIDSGEIFRMFYVRNGLKGSPNANSNDFAKLWSDQVSHLAHQSGTKISIDEIIIKKGDKEMKLQPETFITP